MSKTSNTVLLIFLMAFCCMCASAEPLPKNEQGQNTDAQLKVKELTEKVKQFSQLYNQGVVSKSELMSVQNQLESALRLNADGSMAKTQISQSPGIYCDGNVEVKLDYHPGTAVSGSNQQANQYVEVSVTNKCRIKILAEPSPTLFSIDISDNYGNHYRPSLPCRIISSASTENTYKIYPGEIKQWKVPITDKILPAAKTLELYVHKDSFCNDKAFETSLSLKKDDTKSDAPLSSAQTETKDAESLSSKNSHTQTGFFHKHQPPASTNLKLSGDDITFEEAIYRWSKGKKDFPDQKITWKQADDRLKRKHCIKPIDTYEEREYQRPDTTYYPPVYDTTDYPTTTEIYVPNGVPYGQLRSLTGFYTNPIR